MKDLKKMTIEQLKSYKEAIQEVRSANYGVIERQEKMLKELNFQVFRSMYRMNLIDDEIKKREQEQSRSTKG